MSAEAAKSFMTMMNQDASLKSKVKSLKGDENTVLSGMVKLGAEKKLSFTTDEIKTACHSCKDKMSEAELEKVAGGRCKVVLVTVGYCTDD